MAIIKAGTYRFNDVLVGDFFGEQIIDFMCLGYKFSSMYLGWTDTGDNIRLYNLDYRSIYFLEYPNFSVSAYLQGEWLIHDSLGISEVGNVITVTADTEVTEEFSTWFNANTVEVKPIIKAGTYRFNDVIVDSPNNNGDDVFLYNDLPFTCTLTNPYGTFTGYCTGIKAQNHYIDGAEIYYNLETIEPPTPLIDVPNSDFNVYRDSWSIDYGETFQVITVTADTEVTDEFATWFSANTEEVKPIATITYNGETIANLNAGQTATLKCKGMNMATDVVVEIAENIGSGSSGGECDKLHVIEVDELPTENIDDNALYKVGDAYYQHKGEFLDIWVLDDYTDDLESVVKVYTEQGANVQLYYAKTKPTDNIQITDARANFHVYFIEDEDNAFVYMQGMWIDIGTALELPYIGAVENTENIIVRSAEDVWGLYAVVHKGWKKYPWVHQEVTSDTGALLIEGNGTYDVSTQERVTVDVDSVDGVWEFNNTIVTSHNYKFSTVRDYSVRFTTRLNGETVEGIGMGLGEDHSAYTLQYYFADGSYAFAFAPYAPLWDELRLVDFGTEPQIVSAEFKTWLNENATKQESGAGDELSPMDLWIMGETTELTSNAPSIGKKAFYQFNSLTAVNFPMATTVGDSAFDECSKLTSVNIPMATTLGTYAISYCTNLTSVNIPMATTVGDSAFRSCRKLTTVNAPNITTLGSYAFYSCEKLTTINAHNITSITGESVFYNTGLTEFKFMTKPTSIHHNAFSSSNITNIYCCFGEGEVANAPWGATKATIHYNWDFSKE